MNIYDLITDYLNDEKDALIPLLTWFLNRAMEQESMKTDTERYLVQELKIVKMQCSGKISSQNLKKGDQEE